ncbi:acyltransferase family protein [Pararobbsia silviterrae]|nr:acyltransferase [Pararobbsia silviterrae]
MAAQKTTLRTDVVRNSRIDTLLILRGIACLLVVLSHVKGEFPWANFFVVFGHDYTWTISVTGTTGVWIFFVLSGYLMGKAFYTGRYDYKPRGIARFYRDRFLRIYPLYLASIIVSCIIFHETYPIDAPSIRTIAHLLLFSYYGRTPFPDSVLWTISTEFRFYLLAPLLFFALEKTVSSTRSAVVAAGVFILLQIGFRSWLYLHYAHRVPDWTTFWILHSYIPLIGNFDSFTLGFLLNVFVIKWNAQPRRRQPPRAAGWIVLGISTIVSSYAGYRGLLLAQPGYKPLFFCALESIIVLGVCLTLFCFESHNNNTLRMPALNWSAIKTTPLRSFEIFGVVTFGIYLWHMLVLAWAKNIHFPVSSAQAEFVLRFVLVLAVTTVISAATYLLIEKPFLRLRSVLRWPLSVRQPTNDIDGAASR